MSKTLYEEIDGQFVPVAEHLQYEALPQGAYLLIVTPGCRLTTPLRLHPRHAQLAAALKYLEEDLVKALGEAAMAQPSRKLSPEVVALWNEFEARLGDFRMMLQWPAYYDIIRVAIKKLEDRIIEQCQNPSTTQSS